MSKLLIIEGVKYIHVFSTDALITYILSKKDLKGKIVSTTYITMERANGLSKVPR